MQPSATQQVIDYLRYRAEGSAVAMLTQCRRCERCGVYHRRDVLAAHSAYAFAKRIGVPVWGIDTIIIANERR